jgi:hypothetical protein
MFTGAGGVAGFLALIAGTKSAQAAGATLQQPAPQDHTAGPWEGTGASLTPGELDTSKLSTAVRLERMEAALAVQNTMGRYSYLHTANLHEECLGLFAMKTPGLRVEMMWGVYEGPESVTRLYPGFHVWADGDGKGTMHMHTLSTPIIEVAGDAKTARGVWISPGLETGVFDASKKVTANWGWCKYAADFIKEDGQWKIWHLHVYGLFLSDYYHSWVDKPVDMDAKGMESMMPKEFHPDRPPTTHWLYTPDKKTVLSPVPPTPYGSFDESNSY